VQDLCCGRTASLCGGCARLHWCGVVVGCPWSDIDVGKVAVEFSFVPVLGSCAHRKPNLVVFMDNSVFIGVSEKGKTLAEEARAVPVPTAPCSPDKNLSQLSSISVFTRQLSSDGLAGSLPANGH